MLNTISPADAASERMRSGLGTWFFGGGTVLLLPVPDGSQGTGMPFARPACLPGFGAQADGQVELTRQQRTSTVQNDHLTRNATRIGYIKGGAPLGPHPARDPV